jgi:hypothetical protein
VYTELDLTRPIEPRVESVQCYEQGARSINHQVEPEVYGVSLSWQVEMRADAVPDAIRRARDALLAHGWHDVTDEHLAASSDAYVSLARGARALTLHRAVDKGEGEGGQRVVTYLTARATAPCSRLPDGYSGPLPDNAFAAWDLGLAPLGA